MNDNIAGFAPSSSRTNNEEEETQSTQEETQQATQAMEGGSQDLSQDDKETHLFGSLHPCNPGVARYDLWRMKARYKIGRREGNDIVFSSTKISNFHAEIVWDGKTDETSCVTIKDMNSTNGVYINGHQMTKGSTRILKQGNEIAFGSRVTPETGEDYRFIFYHLAAGSPKKGLYAYYDLGPELGRGSFATVFRAISKTTGEWYAVKMIQESRRTGKEESSSSNVNLQREIAIMQELHHPNICELKDVFVCDNNDINLVIELVEGGDLLDCIINNRITSEGQVRDIIRQLCEALSYIHGKGVAHRDLKPENILLTMDVPPRVKVADFGLAKVADSMTMLKTMCGTPAYLAPEVVRPVTDQGYDNLVDSWSVGVIVFSMLTGQSPFVEDDTQTDIRARIVGRRIDWNALENCPIFTTSKDFIQQLLLEDPRERLTLTASLNHPWLAGDFDHDESQGSAGSQFSADMTGDVSMVSANDFAHDRDETHDGFSQGFGQLKLDSNGAAANVNGTPGSSQDPSSTPPSQPIPGLGNIQQGRPTRGLQRRSQVLEAAQENHNIVVPQPSVEMLTRFSAIDQKRKAEARALATYDHDGDPAAGPSNWAADKGPGKRVHAELSSLPEDEGIDVDADGAINGTTSKKGRPSPPEDGEDLPSTSKRGGKSKSGGRGGKAPAAPPVDDGDETPLRRSSRNAQKAARLL
ncbi:likely protein kinase [Moniliophthora roreri MCA 2997]|uniref:Likely protein kinase n=1 Tax=Moniliophthora roreri (strain MCA 2997) TaxID=1381753 RepID=V2XJC5_MONRO|nr:likely protein kinase [Moniliophthora roreri MCA 2997]